MSEEVRVWFEKGLSLGKLGRYDEALECFDRALEIDPRKWDVWINKGDCLLWLNRLDEAIQCYDKALEIKPMAISVWGKKGTAFALSLIHI